VKAKGKLSNAARRCINDYINNAPIASNNTNAVGIRCSPDVDNFAAWHTA
jgi:hypothetical protein